MATRNQTSPAFNLPTNPRLHFNRNPSQRSQKKPWQSRRQPSFHSTRSQTRPDAEEERLSPQPSRQSASSVKREPKWWKIRLLRGMIDDVKRRLPYYWSDWKDAWNYRVIPATVYMYFAKYDRTVPMSFIHHDFTLLIFQPFVTQVVICVSSTVLSPSLLTVFLIATHPWTSCHTPSQSSIGSFAAKSMHDTWKLHSMSNASDLPIPQYPPGSGIFVRYVFKNTPKLRRQRSTPLLRSRIGRLFIICRTAAGHCRCHW